MWSNCWQSFGIVLAVEPDSLSVGRGAGDHQSARHIHHLRDLRPADDRDLGIGAGQRGDRGDQGDHRDRGDRGGLLLYQARELHAVHPAEYRRVRRVRLQRRHARGGCNFLRLYRVRRGFDGRAGSQEAAARHADRHHRLAGRLHASCMCCSPACSPAW